MKFSVVLCTYNGAKYIEEQISSILNQTRAVDEILVSDDGSADDTIAVAERILSQGTVPYTVFKNEGEKGVAGNFFYGLKRACGDYIFTCDQDDIWLENKVELFAKEAEQSKKMLYFSDGLLVNGEGESLNVHLWDTFGFSCKENIPSPEELFALLLKHPVVTGAAMMVSKELVALTERVGNGWIHDEWLAFLAAAHRSIVPVPQVTFHYRQHGNNVLGTQKYSVWQQAKIWLKNMAELPKIRNTALLRYQSILPYCPEEQAASVRECVEFWQQMCRLNTVGRREALKIIGQQKQSGRYQLYYTGSRGVLRDRIAAVMGVGRKA